MVVIVTVRMIVPMAVLLAVLMTAVMAAVRIVAWVDRVGTSGAAPLGLCLCHHLAQRTTC